MFWIAEYREQGQDCCKRFATPEQLWEWLNDFVGNHMQYPRNLTVYKANCIFDGSYKELKIKLEKE